LRENTVERTGSRVCVKGNLVGGGREEEDGEVVKRMEAKQKETKSEKSTNHVKTGVNMTMK
jgi:hypothetical protein